MNRILRGSAFLVFSLLATTLCPAASTYKSEPYRTKNFTVYAPSEEVAKRVGDEAEYWRKRIAKQWLGKAMPNWSRPCPIRVKVGNFGAGGATTFSFDRGEVYGWNMTIQGTLERILDSVLPHEITHTVLACHFRRPLPRWADEGACTLIEHESERLRQLRLLDQVLKNGRKIPLRQLFAMKEYPSDMNEVMKLYAQGYSLADFLVERGGKQKYLVFLGDSFRMGWDKALAKNYKIASIESLDKKWSGWVTAGSPRAAVPEGQMLADASSTPPEPPQSDRVADSEMIVRGQSPDNDSEAPRFRPTPIRESSRQTHVAVSNNSTRLQRNTLVKPVYRQASRPSAGEVNRAVVSNRSISLEDRLRMKASGWNVEPIIEHSRSADPFGE